MILDKDEITRCEHLVNDMHVGIFRKQRIMQRIDPKAAALLHVIRDARAKALESYLKSLYKKLKSYNESIADDVYDTYLEVRAVIRDANKQGDFYEETKSIRSSKAQAGTSQKPML